MEEHSEELIRIKECYVQLGEDNRGLEQKLREEFEKEKQMLLYEVTNTPWKPVFSFFYPKRIVTNISQCRGPVILPRILKTPFRTSMVAQSKNLMMYWLLFLEQYEGIFKPADNVNIKKIIRLRAK